MVRIVMDSRRATISKPLPMQMQHANNFMSGEYAYKDSSGNDVKVVYIAGEGVGFMPLTGIHPAILKAVQYIVDHQRKMSSTWVYKILSHINIANQSNFRLNWCKSCLRASWTVPFTT